MSVTLNGSLLYTHKRGDTALYTQVFICLYSINTYRCNTCTKQITMAYKVNGQRWQNKRWIVCGTEIWSENILRHDTESAHARSTHGVINEPYKNDDVKCAVRKREWVEEEGNPNRHKRNVRSTADVSWKMPQGTIVCMQKPVQSTIQRLHRCLRSTLHRNHCHILRIHVLLQALRMWNIHVVICNCNTVT